MSVSNSQDSSNVYFAAKSPEETASVLMRRAQSFYNTLNANMYLDKLRRMWEFYHGHYNSGFGAGHSISFAGEQGELVQLPVNHFRNLAQHILVMITSNRPAMEARAVNTDYKSLAQTYLANGILDYYMREKNLEKYLKTAAEMAIVLGSGFVEMEWNATEGEAYDFDEESGEFRYEGDIEFSNLSPFDVVVDGTKSTWNNEWVLIRSFQNRHNLMAKYPELADRIKGIPNKLESNVFRLSVFSNDETDDIPVYKFYHKRTEAMPNGRYLLFLSSDLVLLDADMPYRQIPVFRIVPGEILGTPYGYSPMFDVYPIQETINALYSTIMSNQNAFGTQSIWIPRGSDITPAEVTGGLNLIESDAKPEGINFSETPTEIFKFLEMMIQAGETISGVNSVARGNPQASLESGTALALVQSMALQFVSGLQQSYVHLIEDVGSAIINMLKDFAQTPKIIQLVGKNNRPYLKEFVGEDLSAIHRVIVDIGNPLSRTTAGRVQMAEQLLQMQAIKSPEQYFQVLNTGKLEVMYHGEQSELLLIQREAEMLMDGAQVRATALDAHRLHILQHRNIINDPELRNDINLVKSVQDHIQEHLDFLRNTDPALLQLIGENPLPPIPGMMMPGEPGAEQQPPDGSSAAVMEAPGQPGLGGDIQGPGVDGKLPQLPQVDPNLLPNPGLQDASLGNLNKF